MTGGKITVIGIACAWLTGIALLGAPVAGAQMSMSTSSSSSGTTVVDEQRVIANARGAFETATDARLQDAQVSARHSADARVVVATARTEFDRELRELISELKGDGVLVAREVSDEVDSLRDRYLNRLDRDLAALAAGYAPPPRREQFTSRLDYAAALTRYTLQERNDGADWLLLAAAIAGGLVIAWLLSQGLSALARRFRQNGHAHTAQVVSALSAPLYLATIAIALRLGFEWMWIPGIAGDVMHRIVSAALVGALFWFVWNACHTVAQGIAWVLRKTYNKNIDRHIVLIVSRVLRIVALGVFILLLVKNILDSSLTGLVAGLGIIGVALSFILRGTIENIAASFTILGDEPFRVGDLIVHEDNWGRIEDIGFRSTRLRTLEGHLITIPNSKLIDDDIHNAGARPSIRRRFRLGLPYSTPPAKVEEAMEIIRDILHGHRGQPDDAPPHVAFEAYGTYELTLLVQYNFEPADYWKALEFDSEVNLEIMRRFESAGIDFAFPSQSVYLHQTRGAADGARESGREGKREPARHDFLESESESETETRTHAPQTRSTSYG